MAVTGTATKRQTPAMWSVIVACLLSGGCHGHGEARHRTSGASAGLPGLQGGVDRRVPLFPRHRECRVLPDKLGVLGPRPGHWSIRTQRSSRGKPSPLKNCPRHRLCWLPRRRHCSLPCEHLAARSATCSPSRRLSRRLSREGSRHRRPRHGTASGGSLATLPTRKPCLTTSDPPSIGSSVCSETTWRYGNRGSPEPRCDAQP